MKVNLRIVEELIGFKLPPVDELVHIVDTKLGKVEGIIDIGAKYKDAKIVKVVECEKHPNADRLNVCKIDAGTGELIQVVCGAPNVHAGMWAIWLPPESIVPSSFDDPEPFKLGARELRGVMSNGMLASAKELAIGDEHRGIVELAQVDLPDDVEIKAGDNFARTFGLDGHIIDIENKMFTHRPDLFGQLGVALEIRAILADTPPNDKHTDQDIITPEWFWRHPEFSIAKGLELKVFNDVPEKSARFMAVAMKDITVADSPFWLKCQLVAMGSKPINNIVDLTNYIMLMTAQPTHAYDYDKLAGQTVGVRMAKNEEKITLLNGKSYTLSEDDIVIVDSKGPIGLAGVMGGLDSEVSVDTKNIVLEVANFNMYTVRKTSMRYGLFTDAVTRFSKGQSPLQNDRVIKRLIDLMPGVQASEVFDLPINESGLAEETVHGMVEFSVDFVNRLLGSDFTPELVGNILRLSEFATYAPGDNPDILTTGAPFWRTDIEIPEDVVEEVGRLYGFDELPRKLPVRSTKPVTLSSEIVAKRKIRNIMRRLGANEVLSYSFVHEKILNASGQDKERAFRLSNALSPDLQYYRLSVLPSLLDKVHMNIKAGHDEFILYEIGKGHNRQQIGKDSLPEETTMLDLVYSSKNSRDGAVFYRMRYVIEQLFSGLGVQISFEVVDQDLSDQEYTSFEGDRSARVVSTDGVELGVVGEFKQAVMEGFKLPQYSAGASLDFAAILKVIEKSDRSYRPLSRYPSITQDISLVVPKNTQYGEVLKRVERVFAEETIDISINPVSIYQASDSDTQKTISLSITFSDYDRTLSDKDIRPIMKRIEDLEFS